MDLGLALNGLSLSDCFACYTAENEALISTYGNYAKGPFKQKKNSVHGRIGENGPTFEYKLPDLSPIQPILPPLSPAPRIRLCVSVVE